MEKVKVIMQAHMSSTRLPNKIMLDLKGKPVLYRAIERCYDEKFIDDVIVATSDLSCDDIIEEKCAEWGIKCFRGSDSDVLSRFYGAALQYPCDVYLRATSDSPLNDPKFLSKMIEFFYRENVRYVGGNGKNPTGFSAEVFTFELLEEAAKNATEPFEHEHVTPYMYTKQSSVARYPYEPDHSFLRVTLDTPEDYKVITAVYDALYKGKNNFCGDEIIDFLMQHPEIASLNSSVLQKGLSDNISYKDIFKLMGK